MNFKIVLNSIVKDKIRAILIIVSLMISATVIFLNLIISDDISLLYKNQVQRIYGEYDASISSADRAYFDSSELDFSDIRVKKTCDTLTLNAAMSGDDKRQIKVSIISSDLDQLIRDKLISLESGPIKTADTYLPIIVSKSDAKAYDWKVGDVVRVYLPDRNKDGRIISIAKDTGLFAMTSTTCRVVVDRESLNKILNINADQVNSVFVAFDDETSVSSEIEALKSSNKGFSVAELFNSKSYNSTVDMLHRVLTAILIVVALLNFYIISSNARVMLQARQSEFGTLRSIGANKWNIALMILAENMAYGLIGSILGITMAGFLRNPLESLFVDQTISLEPVKLIYGKVPLYMIATIFTTMGLQLIYILQFILKQGHMSIRELLFAKPSGKASLSKSNIIIGIILIALSALIYVQNLKCDMFLAGAAFISAIIGSILIIPALVDLFTKVLSGICAKIGGAPMELGCKNVSYSKLISSNVILIVTSLAIVLSIYMMSLSLDSAFRSGEEVFVGDILISGTTEPIKSYDYIKNIDGVGELKPVYYSYTSCVINGKKTALTIAGMDNNEYGVMHKKGKSISELNSNEGVIDEYFAIKNDIAIGDRIIINDKAFINSQQQYSVVGYVDASVFSITRDVFIIGKNTYLNNVRNNPIAIYVTVNKDVETMKNQLKSELQGHNFYIQTASEHIRQQESTVNGVMALVWLLLVLALALSYVGLINNYVLVLEQRKREYAVLYSVAMDRRQLYFMLLSEFLITFFISCVLSVFLVFWLRYLLTALMFSIGICLKVDIHVRPLVSMLGISFIALVSTIIIPIRKLRKLDIVYELKYDNM